MTTTEGGTVPTSASLKTATYLLRLSPAEKADLERRAAARNLTLAEALRSGARAYLDELALRDGSGGEVMRSGRASRARQATEDALA
ncbi:MAG: hypothetical protein H0U25_00475 [Thermoleophilaceae bacterium]|nr:hypothetical protein [Thermoleophilaceae bacterium]